MSRWDLPVPESPTEAERFAVTDPAAGGQGVDHRGADVRVGVEVEVVQPLLPREPGGLDAPFRAAPVAVVALGEEQLDEKAAVGQLLLLGGDDQVTDAGAHGR